jgi:AcrR family transcriptional regulator
MMLKSETNHTYHHGDLRQGFIDGACAQLRKASADQLSLRALARDLGVSQTAAYRHFESKNALFAAIATQGFEMMTAELESAAEAHEGDIEVALVEVGLAYVHWALRYPERYQLFLDSSLLDFAAYDDLNAAGANCFAVLLNLITQGKAQGLFVDQPALLLAGIIWSSVHGLTSLLQTGTRADMASRQSETVPQALLALAAAQRPAMEMFLQGIRRHQGS